MLIPGLSATEWPSRWFLPPDLEGEQNGPAAPNAIVGMSRARDRLMLLTGGEPREAVQRAEWALDVREY